ncbi:MAG: tetratricopeptide repeat protein [Bacteroidota bacterium]
MKAILFIPFVLFVHLLVCQDYYNKARNCFDKYQLDSARYHINISLAKKPSAEDYFLSALIYEAQDAPLRALADYEAVTQRDSENIEAYFHKGLIYFKTASFVNAIQDFTYVIDHQDLSQTKAIYFGSDPHGVKGTFITTLQSMKSQVFQYRAMAYMESGEWDLALEDFKNSLQYDSTAELFINRSRLYSKMSNVEMAISDLKKAISLEPKNYLAWYNLALIDESTRLPEELINDESFSPLFNLMGANAYESKEFILAVQYYTKAIENTPDDDLALIGRGKVLLRTNKFEQARNDFVRALQLNPKRTEAFYLIGNSFFYEKSYDKALGFYEQYLSIDPLYSYVWYNAAMSYLSINELNKACNCLKKAADLSMLQASSMLKLHCKSQ